MWNTTNRNFGLDVLRATAILLVVSSHCTFLLPEFNSPLTDGIRLLGATGVDLFFVLSGYLIGGLIIRYLKTGKTFITDLIHFWKRRWLRTLPNYFVVLLLNILLLYFLSGNLSSNIFLFFPFLQNFVTPHPDFFTEAWSLSIEEYAYLLLPAVIYILINLFKSKPTLKIFLFATILVIGLLFVLKYHFYVTAEINSYKDWSASFRKVVIYRLDAIYYGFISVYLVNKYKIISHFRTLLLVFGSLIFISMHVVIVYFNVMPNDFKLFYSLLYLPLISLSLVLLFPWFLELKAKGFVLKITQYLSTRSYAIYLVNYSLVLLTVERFMIPSGYAVLIYLIVSLILSEILYKTIELPMLKLRDRIVPR